MHLGFPCMFLCVVLIMCSFVGNDFFPPLWNMDEHSGSGHERCSSIILNAGKIVWIWWEQIACACRQNRCIICNASTICKIILYFSFNLSRWSWELWKIVETACHWLTISVDYLGSCLKASLSSLAYYLPIWTGLDGSNQVTNRRLKPNH